MGEEQHEPGHAVRQAALAAGWSHRHRDVSGGWLRPTVFGAVDGLVTNASLIAGLGGGGVSAHTVILTGVAALVAGIDASFPKPPPEWTGAIAERKDKNLSKMAETLAKRPSPMNFHSALSVIRDQVKARPDAIVVNEGANTLDFARSIVDMYEPRKRLDVGTWGIMGIGMGFAVAAAVTTGKPVIAIEGDSAFGFSGMEVETICRYNLPVCVIVFNNNGVYRGTDKNPSGTADVAPTVFVKGARYDMLMQAFGGVGVNATTADELEKALSEAVKSGKPTLINAVIDESAGTESGRIASLNPQSAVKKSN